MNTPDPIVRTYENKTKFTAHMHVEYISTVDSSLQIMDKDYFVCRGGRTGMETHIADGSTTLRCGAWVKNYTSVWAVDAPVTCKKCKKTAERLGIPTA